MRSTRRTYDVYWPSTLQLILWPLNGGLSRKEGLRETSLRGCCKMCSTWHKPSERPHIVFPSSPSPPNLEVPNHQPSAPWDLCCKDLAVVMAALRRASHWEPDVSDILASSPLVTAAALRQSQRHHRRGKRRSSTNTQSWADLLMSDWGGLINKVCVCVCVCVCMCVAACSLGAPSTSWTARSRAWCHVHDDTLSSQSSCFFPGLL